MRHLLSLAAFSFLFACAHAGPAAEEHHGVEHGEEPGHEEHEHGAPGSPVSAFHDAMAPLWHAAEGDQRTNDTCAAAANLHALADAVVAQPPATATPAYAGAASGLTAAVAALEAACATPDRAGFADAFKGVHDAFHLVAESAGG